MAATLPLAAGALTMRIPTVAQADTAAHTREVLTGTKPAWATAKADKGATNSGPCRDSSLSAVVGYDDATGVGSPAAGYLKSFARYGGS